MPENNKVTIRNTVSLITTRTEENLPFATCLLMNIFLWAIIARARKLYDVSVCHFIFMANHLHMLIVTNNPGDVKDFVGYIKRESAHLVNGLVGRRKKTIWCKGYDDPKILSPADVIRYIVYIYLNPVKAGLVQSIKQYPGVSSWQMFITNTKAKVMKWYQRSDLLPLSCSTPSVVEQRSYLQRVFGGSKLCSKFILEPWAWIKCFPELSNADIGRIRRTIIDCIEKEEKELQGSLSFVGPKILKSQPIDKEYTPKKYSKKMICICSDIDIRKAFITWYKSKRDKARDLISKLRTGLALSDFPPGFFTPGGVLLANLLDPP